MLGVGKAEEVSELPLILNSTQLPVSIQAILPAFE